MNTFLLIIVIIIHIRKFDIKVVISLSNLRIYIITHLFQLIKIQRLELILDIMVIKGLVSLLINQIMDT